MLTLYTDVSCKAKLVCQMTRHLQSVGDICIMYYCVYCVYRVLAEASVAKRNAWCYGVIAAGHRCVVASRRPESCCQGSTRAASWRCTGRASLCCGALARRRPFGDGNTTVRRRGDNTKWGVAGLGQSIVRLRCCKNE
jgi:hypothetical protein